PQGPPQDHGRGGHPDVPGPGGGAGRRRPRRAVARAGRAGPFRRQIPGQDHAADSGVHADPPGLTWSARLRIGASDSGHVAGPRHTGLSGLHDHMREEKTVTMVTIADKIVLVTGGNRGIGRALVEEALRKGATRVYAGTRQPLAHPDARVTPLA